MKEECRSDSTFAVFFVTDPRFAEYEKFHLLDAWKGLPLTTRTTSNTVFTKNDCDFALTIQSFDYSIATVA
ncbi:unnamed protein product, partial [Mesorhabditis belari]